MRQVLKRWTPALVLAAVGMFAFTLMPQAAHAGCTVELKIVNNGNKKLGFYEVYIKYKKGGGHWVGMRESTKKRYIDKGKSKTLTKGFSGFTSPKCKRKKKVKIRWFTNINKVKTQIASGWVGGKKLKLTWDGRKFKLSAG